MPATGVEEIAPVFDYEPTGTTTVDALLFGRGYEAEGGSTTTTVSYGFPTVTSQFSTHETAGYGTSNSEPYDGFEELSETSKSLVRDAVANIGSFSNLDLVEIEDGGDQAATVRVAWTALDDDEAVAWAYLPGNYYAAGDVWLQSENSSETDVDFHHTIIHEFGHALGLKHSFDPEGDFPAMPSQYEGVDFTVMSYTVSARFPDATYADLWPQTYMYFDILALQYMYGVDTVTTAGNDAYNYDLSERFYRTIWDYDGTDSLSVSGGSTDVHLNLNPGTWSNVGTTIEYWDEGNGFYYDNYTVYIADDTTIENATGASGNDTIEGNDAANTLVGNAGNDSLTGGAGNDVLYGGVGDDFADGGAGNDAIWAGSGDAGNDRFLGGGGNDTIGGGAGADDLEGGAGNDKLYGGSGSDTLAGGTGNNTIWAGSGDDHVTADSGNDLLGGGVGDDTIESGGGNDIIYGGKDSGDTGTNDVIDGGTGNDEIFAGAGNDNLEGGTGNDNLFSGGGNDTVDGGAGNDTLWGGGGDDLFTGGTGSDTFYFAAGHGDDTVTDFSTSDDTLDLSSTTTNFTSSADVEAAASNSGNNLIIDIGGGDSVTLNGLSTSDISDIDFVF